METTGRSANRSPNAFLTQYWAWAAFFAVLLLWWRYRPQIEANTAYETGMLGLLGIVIFFGWPQLTRNSLTRSYFGVMLVVIALISSFSVGMVLLPFLLLYVLIDLFFIAPRER